MKNYNHQKIEKKWQKQWEKDYKSISNNSKKEKRYVLDMFPYPSGSGLHVGHVEGYTATDIYSRFLRMQPEDYDVIHPMGWDAFGLPAENYAIKTGTHPDKSTHENINNFKRQMKEIGLYYNWDREIDSSSPEYYKWTQWFFLLLYKNGLAYKKKAKVNWCEKCQTVLANEQAKGGKCDRCESEVIQKDLEQWFFKITDFIEDQKHENKKIKGLLSGLDDIDWPKSTKIAQKNWIGKSEGINIEYEVESLDEKIVIYTTRPDTNFGATFIVVAPESNFVKDNINNFKDKTKILKYIKDSESRSDIDRIAEGRKKTGVDTGLFAVNNLNNRKMPIYVSDFVLATVGTGLVVGVPGHDIRDFEFAQEKGLEIIRVVVGSDGDKSPITKLEQVQEKEGVMINSGFLNGMDIREATEKIKDYIVKKGWGKRTINYKMRDWLISRQRYWGAPIPMIYCEKCAHSAGSGQGWVPVPEKDLPVELPTDVDFNPTGESPLTNSKTFHNVKCPQCGAKARRESDTMDTFVCSSWYYMRFADSKNNKEFANKKALEKWLPVDMYMGGAEHTVLHLLYARFFTKVLQKYGYVNFNEPFTKLRHQGIILAEDGSKMSKSKGNVISPDNIVKEYGADVLRLYEMFMGSIEDMKPWNMDGLMGTRRFLEKVISQKSKVHISTSRLRQTRNTKAKEDNVLKNLLHKTIKKVGEDIEGFKFNTAISAMMILVNNMEKEKIILRDDFSMFLIILAPFAPHLAEELWSELGNKESIFKEKWPKYDKKLIKDETINLVIQVNGKLRDTISVAADISEKEAKEEAMKNEKIKKWLEGKEIVKIIFVKGRLVNIVIK